MKLKARQAETAIRQALIGLSNRLNATRKAIASIAASNSRFLKLIFKVTPGEMIVMTDD